MGQDPLPYQVSNLSVLWYQATVSTRGTDSIKFFPRMLPQLQPLAQEQLKMKFDTFYEFTCSPRPLPQVVRRPAETRDGEDDKRATRNGIGDEDMICLYTKVRSTEY
jgi:hypothetical protein